MEKPQLVNFIAKVLEDSGFKVYKNFKTSQRVIDIYAVLPTKIGDFGVVMACNNYDKNFEVGIDLLKEMEDAAESLKASKAAVVTSSYFNNQATNYALRRNIKLVDRDNLTELAKKYQDNSQQTTLDSNYSNGDVSYIEEEYPEYTYDADDMDYIMRRRDENPAVYKNTLYPHVEEYRSANSGFSLFNRNKKPQGRTLYPANYQVNLYNYHYYSDSSWFYRLHPYLSNPFITIALVVIVSFMLALFLGKVLHIKSGICGLIEMLVALALSYGLTYIFVDRTRFFINRGTVIFFISLIILIILIFI